MIKSQTAWKVFQAGSAFLYLIIGLMLVAASLFALWVAAVVAFSSAASDSARIYAILTSVGLVVLALATFDVGKYLIEEELFRNRELRELGQARQSMTKFLTILIIAFGLEALVYVFKVGREPSNGGLEQLIYPTLLILATAALLVALGWYQSISVTAEASEKRVPPTDPGT